MNDDLIDITKMNSIHIESYITKDEFLKILNDSRFIGIKYANIDFITGFEYVGKENKTNTRGYNITIE